jgi:hypothetical protein
MIGELTAYIGIAIAIIAAGGGFSGSGPSLFELPNISFVGCRSKYV